MDRNGLYESGDSLYFSPTIPLFLWNAEKTGEFVINLTTEKLAFATDFCGVRSGRDVDKFEKLNLTKEKAQYVSAPMIGEAPVSIECRVREVKELGSHDMFLADVLAVHADEAYMDKNNKFHLNDAGLLVYSHGNIWLVAGRWELLATV